MAGWPAVHHTFIACWECVLLIRVSNGERHRDMRTGETTWTLLLQFDAWKIRGFRGHSIHSAITEVFVCKVFLRQLLVMPLLLMGTRP